MAQRLPLAAAFVLAATASASAQQVLFVDDFESGLAAWSATGNSTGFWHLQADTDACGALIAPFPDPVQSAYFGDITGGCTYDGNEIAAGELTLSAPVALPGEAASLELVFQSYESVECAGPDPCGFDRRLVEVSADGGPWMLVWEGGEQDAWYEPRVDLLAFLGSDVLVRFRFDAVDLFGNAELGWFVDDVRLEACALDTYCVGKTNSLGCVPFIGAVGVPSVTATTPFRLTATDVLDGNFGFLLYGSKKANLNFHGGKLCIKAPVERLLPPKFAKADGLPPCRGVLRRNFNTLIQSGTDPSLSAGAVVFAQWLQRDTGDPAGFGDSLTDAVRFEICP